MKVAVLVGGGICPGINAVIAAIITEGSRQNLSVVGISNGFSGAKRGPLDIETYPVLQPELAKRISNLGGAFLVSSRTSLVNDPEGARQALTMLRRHGVDVLIGIGGDDTLSSLAALSVAGGEQPFPVVHVPKSIDGDLPVPTFGFHTAADECANQAVTVALDVQSMGGGWGLIGMMGRHTGHLAVQTARGFEARAQDLGVYKAASHPWLLIPEMFWEELSLDTLLDILVEAVKIDQAAGRKTGTIIMAEGIFDLLTSHGKERIAKSIGHDDHGHVKLAEIPFFPLLAALLRERLAQGKINAKIRLHEPGFSIRALPPRGSDAELCRRLGTYAIQVLDSGESSVTVYDREGTMGLHPFSQSIGANGRVTPRRVDCAANQDILAPIHGVLIPER